jgi:AcrR family transcriptional regulator
MPRTRPTKRRRTAEEARRAILDAAEKRLFEAGPEAIRLQEVAADVGISHPAVLHHFQSREGLVHAVVERAIEGLQRDLAASISSVATFADRPPDGAALFERVFETLSGAGHARLVAWLLLSGYEPFSGKAIRRGWAAIVEATHAMRLAGAKGKTKPTLEDTRRTVALSALAVFGQAIAGRSTMIASGLGEGPRVERQFRAWLAGLLARHLAGGDL